MSGCRYNKFDARFAAKSDKARERLAALVPSISNIEPGDTSIRWAAKALSQRALIFAGPARRADAPDRAGNRVPSARINSYNPAPDR